MFAFKVCQTIGKVYIPPIVANARLPFWKLFRKEVMEMAHSNKVHTDVMMTLGGFSEFYRRTNHDPPAARILYQQGNEIRSRISDYHDLNTDRSYRHCQV